MLLSFLCVLRQSIEGPTGERKHGNATVHDGSTCWFPVVGHATIRVCLVDGSLCCCICDRKLYVLSNPPYAATLTFCPSLAT